MNTILRELGHRVDFVETGEAAVAAAERGGYDVVLMDVALAGIDGIEATRRIRALPGKAGQVPVIGISGRTGSGDEAAARAAGMNFYFAKPVSPGKLAQALATVIDQISDHTIARAVRPFDDAHQVRHDAVQLEILRRVDRGDAGFLQRRGVLRRNDAADHHRHVDARLPSCARPRPAPAADGCPRAPTGR